MRDRTVEVLNRIGPASAEPIYKQALKLYEQILNMDPGNAKIEADLTDLKSRYNEKDKVAGKNKMPIKIIKAKLSNIYPSLIHYYRKNIFNSVRIGNFSKTNQSLLSNLIFIYKMNSNS